MAILEDRVITVARISTGGWRFAWDVGTPPYVIWLDGLPVAVVEDETYDALMPHYDFVPPALEILDAGDPSENELYPPYAVLQWRGIPNAVAYSVEEQIGASWLTIVTVTHNPLRGYYSHRTQPNPDGVLKRYRVRAVSVTGFAGDPIAFEIETCRNPAPPSVAFSVGSSGDITVSED